MNRQILYRLVFLNSLLVSFSMFVLLKGATKEQAFKIGNEIAEAVTATNPKPVKLKFEKVQSLLSMKCLDWLAVSVYLQSVLFNQQLTFATISVN